MIVILWLLIWVLGMALGIHSILIGAAHLLPRRELPLTWGRVAGCVVLARTFGVVLVLAGVALIYAVCATPVGLPGQSVFKRVYLM